MQYKQQLNSNQKKPKRYICKKILRDELLFCYQYLREQGFIEDYKNIGNRRPKKRSHPGAL